MNKLFIIIVLSLLTVSVRAEFVVITNTATELTGSFDADRFSENLGIRGTPFEGNLPGDLFTQSLNIFVLAGRFDNPKRAGFATTADGAGSDPDLFCFEGQTCSSLFGSYSNTPTGNTVNFAITDLFFAPGGDGVDPTFTGNFSFTVAQVPVPAAVWLFGSALLGLVGIQRYGSA